MTKKILITGLVTGAIVGMLLAFGAARKAMSIKEEEIVKKTNELTKQNQELQSQIKKQVIETAAATLSATPAEKWELVLVNDSHPLDVQYQPELADVAEGVKVDTRIVEDTKQMLADAAAAGMKMHVVSSYRSYDDQKNVFNDTMEQKIYQGSTYLDAYNETKQSVAVPGYSEHALGLAMDITSQDYQELDDKQADTAETKWMIENCYKYGFILRYPSDTIGTTGIVFEPWHYRYVGKEAAQAMKEKGITLEEYLGLL